MSRFLKASISPIFCLKNIQTSDWENFIVSDQINFFLTEIYEIYSYHF